MNQILSYFYATLSNKKASLTYSIKQKLHLLMKKIYFLLFIALIQTALLKAQMVGPDAYIKGTSVEVGIAGSGGYEGVNTTTSPPLAGMHPRSATNFFGFVANPQVNGWATFDGDFFTPGTPENGWGFEIGNTSIAAGSNNCNYQVDIPGSITNFTIVGSCISATWEGNATTGTDLHFTINYFLQTNDLYYTTTVSIKNNTTANIPLMYYYRNVDPDNNVELSFDYTTQNTIVAQPTSGACNLAHVSATQSNPWNSYMGFAGTGPEYRVAHGGFSNRDASDLWNGTGFNSAVGSSVFMDEAIAIAYRIQNLAPGATQTFKYVVILNAASSAAAINNLMYLDYPGAAGAPPSACTPYTDTVRACGSTPISVQGSTVNSFTWSWSPGTGLSSTTGPTVNANPGTTTTYTVTGTPVNSCYNPVSFTFVVEPTTGGGNPPVITQVPQMCTTSPPVTLTADSTGGTWTGPGVTGNQFNPATAGAGNHIITYTLNPGAPCSTQDTVLITVLSSASATINQPPLVCANAAPFNLTAAASGGTWSGTGITNTTNGTFDPSVSGAGAFVITYMIGGTCPSQDTVTVTVGSVSTPTTGFAYTSPVCITDTNPNPTGVAGFTTGGTYSSTAGLSVNSSTGVINLSASTAGTYTVTYNVAATACGAAGSSTATITITPLSTPNTNFTYNTPVCANDPNVYPTLDTNITTGGTFSATPSGLTIDPVTGMISVSASSVGTYTITYSVAQNNALCMAAGSNTASFTINPMPVVTTSSDVLMYIGATTTIYATGGGSYTWNPPTDLSCATCDTTNASPTESTTYCVTVTTADGCIDSACVRVNIEIPCPSNRNLIVPNAFTPDGDGINDKLCLYGWDDCVSKFEIMIFDRWGEKVFESKTPSFCWDGVYKGKQLDPAVFVYFIKAEYVAEGDNVAAPKKVFDVNKKGNITLIR